MLRVLAARQARSKALRRFESECMVISECGRKKGVSLRLCRCNGEVWIEKDRKKGSLFGSEIVDHCFFFFLCAPMT